MGKMLAECTRRAKFSQDVDWIKTILIDFYGQPTQLIGDNTPGRVERPGVCR